MPLSLPESFLVEHQWRPKRNLEPPGWDLNVPVDWSAMGECDAPAHELDRSMVWDQDANGHDGAGGMDYGRGGGATDCTEHGTNVRKRRYYPDDLKVAIYLELLAKTDPPVLHRGVSKQVAQKFGVPQRAVQQVWRNGQDYGGIEGVKNKLLNQCGRKRMDIDPEAIEAVEPSKRRTIKDLAEALGVKKSTLHRRLKEGYFRR
ncbi:hypothetical protein ACP70R_019925 [Stipagrostis hirtigluma subsp. patula]